jgi:DNA endonuclease
LTTIGKAPGSWRVKHDRISAGVAKILYSQARELASRDPSPVRIARQLSASHSVNLSPGTVRHWIIGDRKPRGRNAFTKEPSPALSYVIGANIGDGCTLAKLGIVKLEVADKEFAKAFNVRMRTLLSRDKPNTIFVRYRPNRLPMYIVKYSCRHLMEFLRQPLRELLELASTFPREFLRGFFDAEGHVDVAARRAFLVNVGAENSDKVLLSIVKVLLLRAFGIESKIYRKRKSGSLKVIRGKSFRMRRTSYSLVIMRFQSVKRFQSRVGFSIVRKSRKLKDAITIVQTHGRKAASATWMSLYVKYKGEWIRRDVFINQRY